MSSIYFRCRLIEGSEVIEETYSKKGTGTTEDTPRRGPEAAPQGHNDVITDVAVALASQCLVITAARNGIVKVWK